MKSVVKNGIEIVPISRGKYQVGTSIYNRVF